MQLDQKNIVLTGTSRGLGKKIAQACWSHGANLLLVARSKEGLDALQNELASATVRPKQAVFTCVADLSKENAALTVVNKALTHWTQAHALINNASIAGPIGSAWETDWREWESAMRVNLLAPIELCRAFVPWMMATGAGSIINISGGDALATLPTTAGSSAFSTAEAGLIQFTEVLAAELKSSGVRANALTSELLRGASDDDATAVAELCVFLAADASLGISGKRINSRSDMANGAVSRCG